MLPAQQSVCIPGFNHFLIRRVRVNLFCFFTGSRTDNWEPRWIIDTAEYPIPLNSTAAIIFSSAKFFLFNLYNLAWAYNLYRITDDIYYINLSNKRISIYNLCLLSYRWVLRRDRGEFLLRRFQREKWINQSKKCFVRQPWIPYKSAYFGWSCPLTLFWLSMTNTDFT